MLCDRRGGGGGGGGTKALQQGVVVMVVALTCTPAPMRCAVAARIKFPTRRFCTPRTAEWTISTASWNVSLENRNAGDVRSIPFGGGALLCELPRGLSRVGGGRLVNRVG
jgi:hypothetical protein